MVLLPLRRVCAWITEEKKLSAAYKRAFSQRRISIATPLVVLALLVTVFSSMLAGSDTQHNALARSSTACAWYQVHWGDTLTIISRRYHTSVRTLAHANRIRNINLIYAGRNLCIPTRRGARGSGITYNGINTSGAVRWYAYNALEWSSPGQVHTILYQAAARNGLPARLLLAIAWQESGWRQHVISWDGGIGVMQVMPYTAMGINSGTRMYRDPYRLVDNIYLGATYLRWLWNGFHGNLVRVISAYNEGGWAVAHRGIYNWGYVNSVLYLMGRLR